MHLLFLLPVKNTCNEVQVAAIYPVCHPSLRKIVLGAVHVCMHSELPFDWENQRYL